MPLKRPKPKTMSQQELAEVLEASAQQTGKAKRIRTYDSAYPVFEVQNKRFLAYIPNHTVQKPDGSFDLACDKFAVHSCNLKGREFLDVRCTSNVVSETLGLDGSCPLCNAVGECWELVREEFNAILRSKGGDPEAPDAIESNKTLWQDAKKNMAIKGGQVKYTFPIVVIDCVEKDGVATTTPKKNAEGQISGTPMWITISESAYKEKWLKALNTAPTVDDIEPTSPAGLWVVLDYTYEAEDGKWNAMDAGRKVTVGYKAMGEGYDAWAKSFDQLTESWTPAKAMEVLVANQLRDMEEQIAACDELMKPTREKLALFSASKVAPAEAVNESAESALASFGATEVAGELPSSEPTAPAEGVATPPQVGIATE